MLDYLPLCPRFRPVPAPYTSCNLCPISHFPLISLSSTTSFSEMGIHGQASTTISPLFWRGVHSIIHWMVKYLPNSCSGYSKRMHQFCSDHVGRVNSIIFAWVHHVKVVQENPPAWIITLSGFESARSAGMYLMFLTLAPGNRRKEIHWMVKYLSNSCSGYSKRMNQFCSDHVSSVNSIIFTWVHHVKVVQENLNGALLEENFFE